MFRDTIPRQSWADDDAVTTPSDGFVERVRGGRQHGARQPVDRRELERQGWRTTLEYRENLVRRPDGRLAHVVCEWRAEGERVDRFGEVQVVAAVGPSATTAWHRLRLRTERPVAPLSDEDLQTV